MRVYPPIVKVVWEDAAHDTLGWGESLEKAKAFQVPVIVSVGYLVAENEKGLKICQSITDDAIAQTLVIPRKMIISVERGAWKCVKSQKMNTSSKSGKS
jgi:hypothetical protein